jgi:hypothetical protein
MAVRATQLNFIRETASLAHLSGFAVRTRTAVLRLFSPRGRVIGYAVVLALGSAALHLRLEATFARAGVFRESNVLFDADPAIYSVSFMTGQNVARWGGRSFAHPNVSNAINPPINAGVAIMSAIRPQTDTEALRRRLALSVSPIAAGLESSVIFLTLLELGASLAGAAIVGLLSVAAFSGLIFGSLPESYALSGLGMAILLWLAARTARTRQVAALPWLVAGFFVAGMTITNLAPAALLAFAAFKAAGLSVRAALIRATVGAVAIFAATAAAYQVAALVVRDAPPFVPGGSGQIEELSGFSATKAFEDFPFALANTLAPPVPVAMPYASSRPQQHGFILTYRVSAGRADGEIWRAAITLALLAVGALGTLWMAPWQRDVMLGAALVIAFSWVLHAFFGKELFLYSQHWLAAELILIGGALWYKGRLRIWAGLAIAGLLAACIVDNAYVLASISKILSHSAM